MTVEVILSPIFDKQFNKNVKHSTVWKNCFRKDELKEFKKKFNQIYSYTVKFDGLVPIQCTKFPKSKTDTI